MSQLRNFQIVLGQYHLERVDEILRGVHSCGINFVLILFDRIGGFVKKKITRPEARLT
jgi:hypothetical protein